MLSTNVLTLLLAAITSVSAAACKNPGKREAWHNLSKARKLDYINAELCLMKRPATGVFAGARTVFDEMQAIHQIQAFKVHQVSAFLPWHRLYMHVHETALRELCGYTGYHPYWHEVRDAGNFSKSETFDPVYGFGGNGSGPNNCITTGPFANYTNSFGPDYSTTDQCLDRVIHDIQSLNAVQQQVDICLNTPVWEGAGAVWRGTSTLLDIAVLEARCRMARDRAKRTSEIGGSNGCLIPPHVPIQNASCTEGDPGRTTTLNHVLGLYGFGPDKTIKDVLDIQGDFLCYEYAEP